MALVKIKPYIVDSTGNYTFNGVNATGNLSSLNANLGNAATANYFIGNFYGTANIATTAGTVTTAAQPNITSVGTLGNLNVAGNISAGNISAGNGTGGSITGGNLVSANYIGGTLTTAAQPNITSVGTLTGLTSNGIVNFANTSNVTLGAVGNVHVTGGTTGQYLQTDGAGNLSWASISVSSASISNGNSNVNIPSANGNVNISAEGNANVVVVNGTGITITGSIETTDYIHTTGSANIDGLLTVSSSNSNDPTKGIAFVGGYGNGSIRYYHYGSYYQSVLEIGVGNNLIFASGQDSINFVSSGGVGVLTQTPTVEFEVTGRAKVSGNTEIGGILIATGNANFTGANVSLGSVSNLKITGGTANYVLQTDGAGNLSWAAQSGGGSSDSISNGNSNVSIPSANGNVNISAVGNANILVVTGTGINVAGTLNTGAGVITGNGSGLSSIAGANVSGQVGNALVAGTVYTNAQPNITSVGNLTGLTLSNSTGVVNFSNTANVTLGNVSNLHIDGGSANYVLQTDGAGNLAWAAMTGGGSVSTLTVDTFTGNGVQTVFTLSTTPNNINQTSINYNGATILRSDYTLTGANVTFSSAPADGSLIEVTTLGVFLNGNGAFITRTYTGNAVQTDFTVTSGTTVSSVLVTENGILQTPTTDYTIAGSTLTFTTAPGSGVAIQIRELAIPSTTSGGSALTIQDEGSNLTTTASLINFVGNGVVANNTGNSVTVTINNSGTTAARAIGYSLIFGG